MGQIYVVRNDLGINRSKIEYVGVDKEKAQRICHKNQTKQNPCFIQVWEEGRKQYVTRKLE